MTSLDLSSQLVGRAMRFEAEDPLGVSYVVGDAADPSWPPTSAYHDEGWWRASGELSTLRQRVGATHRMLSTYVNTLTAAGLSIDSMAEPQAEPSWVERRPTAASQPVYLVVRCRARGQP